MIDRSTVVKEIEIHARNVRESVNYIKEREKTLKQEGITMLTLCGGIGTFALCYEKAGGRIKAHIGCEIDPMARAIAKTHHNIDHVTLPQDLTQITATDIQELVARYGAIDVMAWSTPCQGLSRANREGQGMADSRSALFEQAVYVYKLLRAHNPQIKFIAENVDFRTKHPTDYAWACEQLGQAEYSDAREMSAANRKRLFWHNLGEGDGEAHEPIDANTLLGPGARLKHGATTAPCLMASWRCTRKGCSRRCANPHNHTEWQEMYTSNPVIVTEGGRDRQVKPSEAEALMGYPRGYTQMAATTEGTKIVSDMERLQKLGAAIDVRQLTQLMRRAVQDTAAGGTGACGREATGTPIGPVQTTVHQHVKPHREWNTANIARWLTAGDMPGADEAPAIWNATWHRDWQMHDLEDIVRCCTQGFPLRYEGDRERHVEAANGKTCRDNPEVTADELRKEVAKGHIAGPYSEPPLPGFKVVPRGLKEEPTKFRPISQGNKPIGDSVNEGIPRAEHIQLARTRDIDRRIRRCMEETGEVWIAKADIKAAYRTMPVRPEDWQLQGIKWNGEYYIDLRMSFGCRSSVDQWLRFSDALAWSLQRMGVNAPHYVDDFLFIASSEQECQEQVDKFKFVCTSWGVTLKEQKDCGPAQIITVLGVQYDTTRMTRKIDPGRIESLAELVEETKSSNERAKWERLTGILWYVIRCVPVGTPFLQSIMETTLRARAQGRPAAPSRTATEALDWWAKALSAMKQGEQQWHGEDLIQKRRVRVQKAMGDAGSEWGMGGHDGQCFYKARWTDELWQSVQRNKGPSSLHMEALQLLVMTRIMAETWRGSTVVIELDSLGLKNIVRKGRHRDKRMNDILKELALWQVKCNFTLEPQWVRRCYNEAADALSKDDMSRFWRNVQGNRTQLTVLEEHLRLPDGTLREPDNTCTQPGPAQNMQRMAVHQRAGKMRRTKAQRADWDTRPVRQITEPIRLSGRRPTEELKAQLKQKVQTHAVLTDPTYRTRAGVNHYVKFCERIGEHNNIAPRDTAEMVERLRWWLADAPVTYTWKGRKKKGLATGSINVYVMNIDHWWAHTTGNPQRLLTGQPEVVADRKLITASYRSGQRQVHGLLYEDVKQLLGAAEKLPTKAAGTMLRAAYNLAWFGMLRPSEYMLTPGHPEFDPSRHMRAGDIELFRGSKLISHTDTQEATHMTVNVKQSKSDWQRLGATLTIGAIGGQDCPVACMQRYLRAQRPAREGPLFPGLRYQTMLTTLRKLIKKDEELYGLHSFRVGGAQALAMAGRSFEYIMARGRWKNVESVVRYVETPLDIRITDSRDMTLQRDAPPGRPTSVWGGTHYPEVGRPRNTSVRGGGSKVRIVK